MDAAGEAPGDLGTVTLSELRQLRTPEYWRAICPHLHVCDADFERAAHDAGCFDAEPPCSAERIRWTRQRLIVDGYATISSGELRWSSLDQTKPRDSKPETSIGRADQVGTMTALAEGIRLLLAAGWPPTAIVMYDEAWLLGRDASKLMRDVTGNQPVMDTLGFVVDPARGDKGFSPHRDRQPDDWIVRGLPEEVSATFRPDGTAKYATVWVALTAATPDSSCLHFLPASRDPGYYGGDMDTDDAPDPMARFFKDKESYQHVRAAPLEPGACSVHTHRTIHWGNAPRQPQSDGEPPHPPRLSLSFSFADPDFEPCYLLPEARCSSGSNFPSAPARLALMSAQLLNYSSLATTDPTGWRAVAGPLADTTRRTLAQTISLLHKAFQQESAVFHPSYRAEIGAKFLAISAEVVASPAKVSFASSTKIEPGKKLARQLTGPGPSNCEGGSVSFAQDAKTGSAHNRIQRQQTGGAPVARAERRTQVTFAADTTSAESRPRLVRTQTGPSLTATKQSRAIGVTFAADSKKDVGGHRLARQQTGPRLAKRQQGDSGRAVSLEERGESEADGEREDEDEEDEDEDEDEEEEEEDARLAAEWAGINKGSSSADDVLDDALDALLDAEASGVKPFHDDFDSMLNDNAD